jgi:hypothetical protein
MTNQTLLLLALCTAIGCVGCTTTQQSELQAKMLCAKVSAYRQEQTERVNRLNASFNSNYNELAQALDATSSAQLLQDRNDEAQRLADTLVTSPSATSRQSFHDAFLSAEKKDRQAIDDADLAIAAVTASYQKSYQGLSIPLAALKTAEQNLTLLTNDSANLSIFTNAFQKIYSAYQSLSKASLQAKNPLKPTTPVSSATTFQ